MKQPSNEKKVPLLICDHSKHYSAISLFQSRTSYQPTKSISPEPFCAANLSSSNLFTRSYSCPYSFCHSAAANLSGSNLFTRSYSGGSNSRCASNFSTTGYMGFCQLCDQQGHSTKHCPRVHISHNHPPMANPATSSRPPPSPTKLIDSGVS